MVLKYNLYTFNWKVTIKSIVNDGGDRSLQFCSTVVNRKMQAIVKRKIIQAANQKHATKYTPSKTKNLSCLKLFVLTKYTKHYLRTVLIWYQRWKDWNDKS